jgi:hypothetical protein
MKPAMLKRTKEGLLYTSVLIMLAVFCFAQDKQLDACRSTSPQPTSPPTVVVQVVDPVWLPIPGASVSLSANGRQNHKAYTDREGNARFWVAENTEYAIEAEKTGFKRKRLKHLYIHNNSDPFPTAYVQVKLGTAGKVIIVE